jgi:hypothetical protein
MIDRIACSLPFLPQHIWLKIYANKPLLMDSPDDVAIDVNHPVPLKLFQRGWFANRNTFVVSNDDYDPLSLFFEVRLKTSVN